MNIFERNARLNNENNIKAKQAMLRVLMKESDELTGRFLSKAEGLRAISINDEIERLDAELCELLD